jgi:hypothetical protein
MAFYFCPDNPDDDQDYVCLKKHPCKTKGCRRTFLCEYGKRPSYDEPHDSFSLKEKNGRHLYKCHDCTHCGHEEERYNEDFDDWLCDDGDYYKERTEHAEDYNNNTGPYCGRCLFDNKEKEYECSTIAELIYDNMWIVFNTLPFPKEITNIILAKAIDIKNYPIPREVRYSLKHVVERGIMFNGIEDEYIPIIRNHISQFDEKESYDETHYRKIWMENREIECYLTDGKFVEKEFIGKWRQYWKNKKSRFSNYGKWKRHLDCGVVSNIIVEKKEIYKYKRQVERYK